MWHSLPCILITHYAVMKFMVNYGDCHMIMFRRSPPHVLQALGQKMRCCHSRVNMRIGFSLGVWHFLHRTYLFNMLTLLANLLICLFINLS